MKRFYREVSVAETADGHRVLLDGRAVKTQGGRAQAVPSRPLAQALAAEWADQGDEIDPTRFFMRDLADYAIDVVAPDPAQTCATLIGYAETDTLCYRAYPDEPFAARQHTDWEPLVTAAEARFDVRFVRVAGVIHRPQPPETLARLRAHIDGHDAFALAGLHTLTSLAASLIIGLAALESAMTIDALWDAANLEELWQAELWGKVPEAEARRARRHATFAAAARFTALARG
ncbi:ATP12 family protein [Novosphingobium sp.]|uniref:ATP12 family chaperone protein n=1 Tax=Novosphingobium sp. TaxID=1874826 RepID=UPI00333FEE75